MPKSRKKKSTKYPSIRELNIIKHYFVHDNKAAAMRHGGYKEQSAYKNCTTWFNRPHIKKFIEAERERVAKKFDVTAEKLILAAAFRAFPVITEICSWNGEGMEIADSANIPREIAAAIQEIKITEYRMKQKDSEEGQLLKVVKNVKLHDPKPFIEFLAKACGLFKEQDESNMLAQLLKGIYDAVATGNVQRGIIPPNANAQQGSTVAVEAQPERPKLAAE